MRTMIPAILGLTILAVSVMGKQPDIGEPIKITPAAESSCKWPYYLYIPDTSKITSDSCTLLVIPNNSGKCDDDIVFHEQKAARQIDNIRDMADYLGLIVLVPIFPRPSSHDAIYTHALDRDAVLTDIPALHRLDLQLCAMIDDARRQCGNLAHPIGQKILMFGQSASGMFVNRFTILHPEIVKAAAIGSPGGWPMAPLEQWNGKRLRYPVGISDLSEITGKNFDRALFDSIPFFFFMGDQDDNDAVLYDDAYDLEDRTLVLNLFGDTPIKRWPAAQEIYKKAGSQAEFRLYDGAGHTVNNDMWRDIRAFLKKYRY